MESIRISIIINIISWTTFPPTYFTRNKKEDGEIYLVDNKNRITSRHVGALIYFSQLAITHRLMDEHDGGGGWTRWQSLFCISSCLVILSSPHPLFGLDWMNMMKTSSSVLIMWTIRLTAGYCCCCSRLCYCWGVRRCIKSLRITLSETILINRALGQPFLVKFSVSRWHDARWVDEHTRRLSICLLILQPLEEDNENILNILKSRSYCCSNTNFNWILVNFSTIFTCP